MTVSDEARRIVLKAIADLVDQLNSGTSIQHQSAGPVLGLLGGVALCSENADLMNFFYAVAEARPRNADKFSQEELNEFMTSLRWSNRTRPSKATLH